MKFLTSNLLAVAFLPIATILTTPAAAEGSGSIRSSGTRSDGNGGESSIVQPNVVGGSRHRRYQRQRQRNLQDGGDDTYVPMTSYPKGWDADLVDSTCLTLKLQVYDYYETQQRAPYKATCNHCFFSPGAAELVLRCDFQYCTECDKSAGKCVYPEEYWDFNTTSLLEQPSDEELNMFDHLTTYFQFFQESVGGTEIIDFEFEFNDDGTMKGCEAYYNFDKCNSCMVSPCEDSSHSGYLFDCSNLEGGIAKDTCEDFLIPEDSPFFYFRPDSAISFDTCHLEDAEAGEIIPMNDEETCAFLVERFEYALIQMTHFPDTPFFNSPTPPCECVLDETLEDTLMNGPLSLVCDFDYCQECDIEAGACAKLKTKLTFNLADIRNGTDPWRGFAYQKWDYGSFGIFYDGPINSDVFEVEFTEGLTDKLWIGFVYDFLIPACGLDLNGEGCDSCSLARMGLDQGCGPAYGCSNLEGGYNFNSCTDSENNIGINAIPKDTPFFAMREDTMRFDTCFDYAARAPNSLTDYGLYVFAGNYTGEGRWGGGDTPESVWGNAGESIPLYISPTGDLQIEGVFVTDYTFEPVSNILVWSDDKTSAGNITFSFGSSSDFYFGDFEDSACTELCFYGTIDQLKSTEGLLDYRGYVGGGPVVSTTRGSP